MIRKLFESIGRWWRKRQRNIDRECLFPALLRRAGDDREVYLAMVFHHVMHDGAWRYPSEWVHSTTFDGASEMVLER